MAPGPFPRGRRCAESNCDTILSTYNPTETCWVHTASSESATKREHTDALTDLLDVMIGGVRP